MPLDAVPSYADAGARILSLQPPISEIPKTRDDWPEIYQHCESRIASLRSWRYSWWQHWAILAQYFLPYRYHWVVAANTFDRGFPVNDSIVNETGVIALRTCAAGMLAGFMSEASPWFKLGPAIEGWPIDSEGQDWLDDTSERGLAVLSSSNWYTTHAQGYKDQALFGQDPIIVYEDAEDVIRNYLACAGEYFLGLGGDLKHNTLAREFTLTVEQIVNFFHLENCPEEVQNMWNRGGGSLDREFVVCHLIEPNFALASRRGDRKSITVVPGSFLYREIYWLRGRQSTRELLRRGFHERPFIVPGWERTSNDAYYRSPGMEALGGGRQLQQQERRYGEFIDKGVRPPMGADVSLQNQPASIVSGDITYLNASDGKEMFFPLFQPNPAYGAPMLQSIERIEKRLERCFFTDLFLMISQMEGVQPRNELEISERKGEKIQMLGPVISGNNAEIAVGIQRVLNIMMRRGLVRPMPPSLRRIPIGVKYTNTMALLQRAATTATFERVWGVAAKLQEGAQAANLRGPLRIMNLEEGLRDYAQHLDFPAKLVYTAEQVQQNDQAAMAHEQQQELAQATLPAVQAAEGLSKIPVGGGGSALDQVLGTGGGNAGPPAGAPGVQR